MTTRHANQVDNEKAERPSMQWVPTALGRAVAEVLRESYARGRTAYNWRTTPISYMEMIGALERHIAAIKDRHDVDEKSKLHPLKHIAATCAIMLDALQQQTLKDDRPVDSKGIDGPFTLTDAVLASYLSDAWLELWLDAIVIRGEDISYGKDLLIGKDVHGMRRVLVVNKVLGLRSFDCGPRHEIVQVVWREAPGAC
jgi:hypothetical protein